jgi:hypothetical protein
MPDPWIAAAISGGFAGAAGLCFWFASSSAGTAAVLERTSVVPLSSFFSTPDRSGIRTGVDPRGNPSPNTSTFDVGTVAIRGVVVPRDTAAPIFEPSVGDVVARSEEWVGVSHCIQDRTADGRAYHTPVIVEKRRMLPSPPPQSVPWMLIDHADYPRYKAGQRTGMISAVLESSMPSPPLTTLPVVSSPLSSANDGFTAVTSNGTFHVHQSSSESRERLFMLERLISVLPVGAVLTVVGRGEGRAGEGSLHFTASATGLAEVSTETLQGIIDGYASSSSTSRVWGYIFLGIGAAAALYSLYAFANPEDGEGRDKRQDTPTG